MNEDDDEEEEVGGVRVVAVAVGTDFGTCPKQARLDVDDAARDGVSDEDDDDEAISLDVVHC